MKIKFIIFLLILISSSSFGQEAYKFYKPDGTIINGEFLSIKSILDSLKSGPTTSKIISEPEVVYFKKLTNIPVMIMLNNNTPFKGKQYYISKYKYQNYINSYSYFYDLNSMIKEKSLTQEYLKEVFGAPTRVEDYKDQKVLTYSKYNLKVNVNTNGDVFYADVHNYSACSKNGLSIEEYSVTGEEYSIGFNVTIENYSKKTIKYISFTVQAKNDVNDAVGSKTVRGVGPIKYGDKGSYNFDDIIYSHSATKLNLLSIKIQYMDGTIKNIIGKQIDGLIKTDWIEEGNKSF